MRYLIVLSSLLFGSYVQAATYFTCHQANEVVEGFQFVFADDQSIAQIRQIYSNRQDIRGTIKDVDVLEFSAGESEYFLSGLYPNGTRNPVEFLLEAKIDFNHKMTATYTDFPDGDRRTIAMKCEGSESIEQYVNDPRFSRTTTVPHQTLRCKDSSGEYFFNNSRKGVWSAATIMPSEKIIGSEHLIQSYNRSSHEITIEGKGVGFLRNANFVYHLKLDARTSKWNFDWRQVNSDRADSGPCIPY